jgi:electron transport complex protein RnfG
MHETLKLIIVLGLIATISGGVLAYVHQTMAPAIEENKRVALGEAILEVLPEATSYEVLSSGSSDGDTIPTGGGTQIVSQHTIYRGVNADDQHAGIAFVAEGNGFGGNVQVMVGLDPTSRRLVGVKILDHLETPGLGARITEPAFGDQFVNKSLDDAYVAKEDVDIITGATISSRAVASAIKNTLVQIEPVLRAGGVWE